tara:strand:- start:1307 stop:2233 length:927 start_codon:yes stop_codon:yes gene_type:complete
MSTYSNNKILIYGGGGIGSYYAGALSKNGHNVTLLTRGNHFEKIKKNGLKLKTNWGNFTQKINLVREIDAEYDVVILAVKTYSVKTILSDLKLLKKGSKIICIQNGTYTYNYLSEHLKDLGVNVIDGLTWIDALRKDEGSVIQTGDEAKIIFGKNNILDSEKLELNRLAISLDSKNVQTQYVEDISKAVWKKLIMVAAIGSIMCYSNMPAKETVKNKNYLNILKEMINEMTNASISIGVNIEKNYAENTLNYILGRADELHSSLKEDFDKKRPLEVDEILGEALRTGIKNKVKMTYCKKVYDKLIKFA